MKIRVCVCVFVMVLTAAMLYTGVKLKAGAKHEGGDLKKVYKALKSDKSKSCTQIMIPDTNIDYKVCRPKDNSYYLRRNASGNPDKNGAIFYDCNTARNDDNAVIYGHNMQNNKMFSELEFYRKERFARLHDVIYIMEKRSGKVLKRKYMVKAWMMVGDGISKQGLDELKKSFVNKEEAGACVYKLKRYCKINGNESIMLVTCASRRFLENKRILVYAERL